MSWDEDKAAQRCARMWFRLGKVMERMALDQAERNNPANALQCARIADVCLWQATGVDERRASMTKSPQPGEILTSESVPCLCVDRATGPEGCGLCNETGVRLAAPSVERDLGSSPAAIPTVQADDPVAGDKATGAQAVIRDGKIVISVDVDALPLIVSGSCCISDGLSGLWSVTDANLFAKEVCTSLNREREDGTTPVHAMFDKAFAHAINQGAEGIESVSEDEFEAVASQLQQTALATTVAEPGTVGMERGNAVRNEPKSTEPDVAGARERLLEKLRVAEGRDDGTALYEAAADEIQRQGEEIERLRGALETAAVWLADLADVVETSNAKVSAKNRKWKGDVVREWARRCRDARARQGGA